MSLPFDPAPYEGTKIFEAFESEVTISRHLLTLYSMVVGLHAQVIVDMGLGSTTKALRTAARKTGGTVYTCDMDPRWEPLIPHQGPDWKFFLMSSDQFLEKLPVPVDFALHDAAHDYYQVKKDLEALLPKMRTFGLICLHDTQAPNLADEMLAAVRDATRDYKVSFTNLPYSGGLGILRVEESPHPQSPLREASEFEKKYTTTRAAPSFLDPSLAVNEADTSWLRWARWRLRKLVKGY